MTKDLNRMAATEVMGWVWSEEHQMWCDGSEGDADGRLTYANPDELDWINDDPDELGHQVPWTPLTDLNQCFQVVDRITEDERPRRDSLEFALLRKDGRWSVEFYRWGQKPWYAMANTPNEAIIKAALKAKGVEEIK